MFFKRLLNCLQAGTHMDGHNSVVGGNVPTVRPIARTAPAYTAAKRVQLLLLNPFSHRGDL